MRTDTDEQTDAQTHSHQLHGQKEFQETMCTQDCGQYMPGLQSCSLV